MRTPRLVFVALVLLLLSACGGDTDEPGGLATGSQNRDFQQSFVDAKVYPVFVSSELTVGSNRFIIGLLDSNDAPVNNPDIEVSVDFFDLAESRV